MINARGACSNPDHLHETYFLADGTAVGEPVAMMCWGQLPDGEPCARSAHTHLPTGQYCHNDADAPVCDMAGAPVTKCNGRSCNGT